VSRYRLSSLARLDLDSIHNRIASDKPGAARRWLKRSAEQFYWLAKNPEAGQARDEILSGLRSFSHGSYVIYYRSQAAHLEIVRVLHGARDIEGLF
jgi:toxin ParE1/3/4